MQHVWIQIFGLVGDVLQQDTVIQFGRAGTGRFPPPLLLVSIFP
jgi:hypothetical protein